MGGLAQAYHRAGRLASGHEPYLIGLPRGGGGVRRRSTITNAISVGMLDHYWPIPSHITMILTAVGAPLKLQWLIASLLTISSNSDIRPLSFRWLQCRFITQRNGYRKTPLVMR